MKLISLIIVSVVVFSFFVYGMKSQAQQERIMNGLSNLEKSNLKTAILAGGCFWCLESDLDRLDGIEATISGYSGGSFDNPTYKDYYKAPSGETPHVEAVQVWYDPKKIGFDSIVHYYFRNIDPFDGQGQFYDRGPGYRPVIYYSNDAEKVIAEAQRAEIEEKHGKKTAVSIEPATTFWPAEEYHQDFYQKSPEHYKRYRKGSGRDAYIEKLWDGKE
ncbi:MAG: peptide-methionine (S)-S-oxide reductase [Micavibrio sp.]|nr:peptide-methionine (S)-S-oxide reductase [Micavibrio sp.]|tara:strand:- start:613 stop:1263 length:651 start_codon:yes stop_codon:yes gene_type:complete